MTSHPLPFHTGVRCVAICSKPFDYGCYFCARMRYLSAMYIKVVLKRGESEAKITASSGTPEQTN